MRKFFFLGVFFLLSGSAFAQPIQSPFPFVQAGKDTSFSALLPASQGTPITERVVIDSNGHFALFNIETAFNHRIRFFGTELDYSAEFLNASDANILAKRLHKLGFNAVRLTSNDETWWPQASFFNYTDTTSKTSSYDVNALSLARFDTLINAFKQNGIYVFLVLNSLHTFSAGDGASQPDSQQSAQFLHFIDPRAAELHRNWAKTLLGHTNPLTGTKLGAEPALAGIEVTSPGMSLIAGWRFGYLNWIDKNNTINKGAQTMCWHNSRRLDTLFSQYLLKKYGSDQGIDNAWKGAAVTNAPNLVANGSFEDIASSDWSFTAQNGATGGTVLLSPGIDSQYCMLMRISALSSSPNWYDAYIVNATPRLGKDTLYQVSFYAKIHFNPAKPVLSRTLLVYVEQYDNYIGSFSTYQTIDTTWKKYTFTFRAAADGLQRLYFGIGQALGDVELDGVQVTEQQEYGLVFGELASNSTIARIKFGATDLLPRQRVRDLALFYDSLQNNYFLAMKKCIADTIGSQVLVNFYCPEWWGTLQDIYANRNSDFTQAHINTDYPRQRNANAAWTDSTWVMSNTTILNDLYNGTMGYLASGSISGKPFIGRYMNLVMNQQSASAIPFWTAYASLQDWDGIFFVNYANYYEDLFAGYARYGIWWSIAGNPSMLVQLPQASDAFRNQKITASTTAVKVSHDADDVLLESVPNHYSGPFGVEGWLDPNIATLYQVREQFDAKHKVAAQYPYNSDTATKVSETGEIKWSQTGGYLEINSNGFSSASGYFGSDTVSAGNLRFHRIDGARDMLSVTLSQNTFSPSLLTIATRSQNFFAIWQYNDSSIGNHWGKYPTIMEAGKFEFFMNSDSNRLIAQALDSSGNPTSMKIEGVKIPGTNTFKIVIDQSLAKTPWFAIEASNQAAAVAEAGNTVSDFEIMPNPASGEAHIKFSLVNPGIIKISIYDDLGRKVSEIANGELFNGSYDLPLSVQAIPAGHYIIKADCGGKIISRSLNVIR